MNSRTCSPIKSLTTSIYACTFGSCVFLLVNSLDTQRVVCIFVGFYTSWLNFSFWPIITNFCVLKRGILETLQYSFFVPPDSFRSGYIQRSFQFHSSPFETLLRERLLCPLTSHLPTYNSETSIQKHFPITAATSSFRNSQNKTASTWIMHLFTPLSAPFVSFDCSPRMLYTSGLMREKKLLARGCYQAGLGLSNLPIPYCWSSATIIMNAHYLKADRTSHFIFITRAFMQFQWHFLMGAYPTPYS